MQFTAGGQVQNFASDGFYAATLKQPTNEVHVATNGSDETGDGSKAKPYATVTKAVKMGLTPGTAVRIHAGTYTSRQWVQNIAGTLDAPTWIGGAPGEAKAVVMTSRSVPTT